MSERFKIVKTSKTIRMKRAASNFLEMKTPFNKFIHSFSLLILSAAVSTSGHSQTPEKKKTGPERFEKEIAGFEARDRKTPPPKHVPLFVGSSSIRLWDLEKAWPDSKMINNGFGGSTLADSIHFFDRAIAPYSPSSIAIYAGDNDIGKGLTAEQTYGDFVKLAGMIQKKHPEAVVIFIAIKPSIKRWELWPKMKDANDRIAKYCEENPDFFFADIAAPVLDNADKKPSPTLFRSDGLHLNEAGYAVWKAVIDPLLFPKP